MQEVSYQDVKIFCDYADHAVESFSNKNQSEYYVGNILISIEVIELDRYCVQHHLVLKSMYANTTSHAVFHSVLFNDRKYDAATTYSHCKNIVEVLKECKLIFVDLRTISQNKYGCVEKYRCVTVLYFFVDVVSCINYDHLTRYWITMSW